MPRLNPPAADKKKIGRHIKAAREKRGWTGRELARRVGVAPSSVCEWEKGRASPSAKNLAKVSRETGESTSFFLSDSFKGRSTLEAFSRELGVRLGFKRVIALLDVPDARLRREADAVIGAHLVESSTSTRK